MYWLVILFENFDVIFGCGIVIDSDVVFVKLVMVKCGGFCFEYNWLFFDVLIVLGFVV